MNKKLLTGLVVSTSLLFSCGPQREVTYSNYSSADNTYSIDIPTNAVQGKCIADLMSFENANSHLRITIQSINERSIKEYVRNKDITNNTFSYSLFQSTDTTHYYKVTRGNNMWSAYDLYMLKRLEGKNYLINVNSDVLGQSELIEIIKHIYSSMTLNKKNKTIATLSGSKEDQAISLETTYSPRYYSIKYPKGWQKQEHLNEMTDVYIGYQPDNFGFTIVRFETDYSLTEVKDEANKNARQAGYKILDEKQIKVDGVKCYRDVQEISLQSQKVKHISYTFKKGNMLYNIKFGSVSTKAQEELAAKIIESFRFK